MRTTQLLALLFVALLQGCFSPTRTALRTTPSGRIERFQCLPHGTKTLLPLLATVHGAALGGLMVLAPRLPMGGDPPDMPPLIQIGAVAGLVIGLVTVAVVPECPRNRWLVKEADSHEKR